MRGVPVMMSSRRSRRRTAAMVAVAVLVGTFLPVGAAQPAGAVIEYPLPDIGHRHVEVGQTVSLWLRPVDGRPGLRVTDRPAGSSFWSAWGLFIWTPSAADVGRHTVRMEIDDGPYVRQRSFTVDVRHPAHPQSVVALGDSIASGAGLSRRDYLGGDDCWRAEGRGYPDRTANALEAIHGADLDRHIVACAGATAGDLLTDPVKDGLTQLDWVRLQNPGLITLTVGANDLRFDKPTELFAADGTFDWATARARIAAMGENLALVLDRLVAETDATIVLTLVHNPVSPDPHGVPGCRGDCFVAITGEVLGALNAEIAGRGGVHPGRVILADPSPLFVGHGAPNGRGPDRWRSGNTWWARYLPVPTAGVHPYCEQGHSDIDTWINAADCVHPNGEGHQAYADVVVEALQTAGWTPTPS